MCETVCACVWLPLPFCVTESNYWDSEAIPLSIMHVAFLRFSYVGSRVHVFWLLVPSWAILTSPWLLGWCLEQRVLVCLHALSH